MAEHKRCKVDEHSRCVLGGPSETYVPGSGSHSERLRAVWKDSITVTRNCMR